MSGRVDIMLSHDWPRGIEHHGNTHQLLQWKPHFRQDVRKLSCMYIMLAVFVHVCYNDQISSDFLRWVTISVAT